MITFLLFSFDHPINEDAGFEEITTNFLRPCFVLFVWLLIGRRDELLQRYEKFSTNFLFRLIYKLQVEKIYDEEEVFKLLPEERLKIITTLDKLLSIVSDQCFSFIKSCFFL